MLNEAAILDQKIAVGLIENPCRDVLIDLASKVPAGQAIVELGSFKGRSTGHLALGSSRGAGVQVHAFDPWEAGEIPAGYEQHAPSIVEYVRSETRAAFDAHMELTGAGEYVTAHQATATEGAEQYDGLPVGLLFHDALHRKEDVRDDLKAWLPHMADDAVIVLHDVGDPRFEVEEGARLALARNKTLRERWDFEGREVRLWAKNPAKRGFCIVRSR